MKKIDQKQYDVRAFEILLRAQISSVYPDKSIVNKKIHQLAHLLENEEQQLTAKSFFRVSHALKLDLTVVCYEFFKNLPSTRLQTFGSPLEKLFGLFLNSKSDVSAATGLSEARINDLFNRSYDQFYAYEICSLAIAFGITPSTLFEYFYDGTKKKAVLKLELVDDINRQPNEVLFMDQSTDNDHIVKEDKTTSTLRKVHSRTFDDLVKHTDYFSTPRSPKDIIEDLKLRYNLSISAGNVYSYLKKYTNNELTKIKAVQYTAIGTRSNKPTVTYIKTRPQRAKNKNAEDHMIIKKTKNRDEYSSGVLDQQEQIDDPVSLDQLYELIAGHPNQRLSFYLTVFDVKATVLQSKLQKLQEQGKIEYCGTRKSGGYWAINKEG